MSLTLKEQVLQMVASIDDDETLQIIKQDIELINTKDITDDLSAADFEELKNMLNEPLGYETISQKQFDESIQQRRKGR